MFNMSGSEIIFLLVIGLVVLGPEKLPTALRKAGRLYGEFKRITTGAESEFRTTFAEPIREMQATANTYKSIFSDAAGGVAGAAKGIAKSVANEYNSAAASQVQDPSVKSDTVGETEIAATTDAQGESEAKPDDVVEGI